MTRGEFLELICSENVRKVLLERVEEIGRLIPEVLPMVGFDQKNYHHIYNVWEHTACAVGHTPPEVVLRLAALFHDMGKPHCFSLDNEGVGHFYGHAKVSAELAQSVMNRLEIDRALIDRVVLLVRYHDSQIEGTEKAVGRALRKLTPEGFFQLIQLKRADNLAQHPDYWERQGYYDELEALGREVLSKQPPEPTFILSVDGNDLIAAGMTPGKELGDTLRTLRAAVESGEMKNEKGALLGYITKR